MKLQISALDAPRVIRNMAAIRRQLPFGSILGSAESNAKTAKGIPLFPELEAAICYLAPATIVHRNTVCPWSTRGCRASCLNTSGRGQTTGSLDATTMSKYLVHKARIARTQLYHSDRQLFIDVLADELRILQNRADRREKYAIARLNGTSDIPWETVASELFCTFPRMQFYDYTKGEIRANRYVVGDLPPNYHLTFSRGEETSDNTVIGLVQSGCNVAVVFHRRIPAAFLGIPVIDGNLHDFRSEDVHGVIVGLTGKARAKADSSGFVIVERDPRIGGYAHPLRNVPHRIHSLGGN